MNRTFHRIALASLAAAAIAAIGLPTSGANGTYAALASNNHAVRFPLVRSATRTFPDNQGPLSLVHR